MIKKNKYYRKRKLINQILIKYFSIKSGNDNPKLLKDIDNLINQLKGSGLRLSVSLQS